ncbi:unnamed protein product [Urochloa decumbens]|uniref:DUF7378 domain-containing protein n=1 Tax=Urochloa decumbens TaxID=240449 RepID=A0ABC9GS78_9POAL
MSPPAALTIGEARPNVPRARFIVGTIFLVCLFFAVGYVILRIRLLSEPLLLACVPWLLPLWILWGVYMSLALVISAYANMFLPRTPVAVDEAITYVAFGALGGGVLGPMEVIALGLPIRNQRVVIAFTGVVAAFIAGLLVFWVWLVCRYYRGPAGEAAGASNVA